MITKHLHTRVLVAYAQLVVRRPATMLAGLVILALLSTWATTRLTINANQLDLIRQDLPEVKDVRRVIDMVGGAGYLVIGLRGSDPKTLRSVADDLNAALVADPKHVRFVSYRLPLDFMRRNIGLFVETADLAEARRRITVYLRDQIRRASPFYVELRPTPPVKLELDDLVAKYAHVGKKSLRDDYDVSDDGKMLLLHVKPMWDSSDLGATQRYLGQLRASLSRYSAANQRGVHLRETTDRKTPGAGLVTFGLTGAYKLMLDDSFAIAESLGPVSLLAFVAILLITIAFFRRIAPTVIVISGMVVGTVISMGFAWLVFRQLNMVTSILGGILMGFGVDYGIQFIYRARIELGDGKAYQAALEDAIVQAGRPASVAAVVTAGTFFMLLISDFRGFSEFGLLAGCGTLIIAATLFCWSPAILALLGRWSPELPARLIGVTAPPLRFDVYGERRIKRPWRTFGIAVAVVLLLCAAAVPWRRADAIRPFSQRILNGIFFDYDTRTLLPAHQASVEVQDEIHDRFGTSADTVAIFTKDFAGAKEVYDEIQSHPQRYSTVAYPVLSIYTFVPPPQRAKANAVLLADWRRELADIDVESLPPELQDKAKGFFDALAVQPWGVEGVPEIYASQFRALPTSRPENRGYLTYLYAKKDLRNGKELVRFADQVHHIRTASGRVYRASGPAILYAMLARTVLRDGCLTVLLAALWILAMHYIDLRSVKLAAASVIPLVAGLGSMLGILALAGQPLNFMNIIILPILLGFGISHGLYLLHRFLEGTSPVVALQSVGAAVAASTLTAIAGFAALFVASHRGLQSMGLVACVGLATTLVVSFTVLAAVLQVLHDRAARASGRPHIPQLRGWIAGHRREVPAGLLDELAEELAEDQDAA